jgi:hypothetical protein
MIQKGHIYLHTATHRAMILARLYEEWIGQHGNNKPGLKGEKG